MKYALTTIIAILSTAWISNAATISPASFCLDEFDIGMNMDLGIDFAMSNVTNSGPIDIKSEKPLADKVIQGYIPIPDPSWFYFLNSQIVPGKDGVAKARMFFKVPHEQKYLNQHWVVHVGAKPPPTGVFAMKMFGVYMIETRASRNIKSRPYGKLGVVPSRVYAKNIIPMKKISKTLKLYNNDTQSHTYLISIRTFDPSQYNNLRISQAKGYEWVKDAQWVSPESNSVTIKAGGQKEIRLWVTVPKKIQYQHSGWEAIVMVSSQKNGGPSGFARLLISFPEGK